MQIRQKYLNDLLCGPFCLQHSKTFDISHAFLRVTTAELSTLKQVRFFGPPCIFLTINGVPFLTRNCPSLLTATLAPGIRRSRM